MAHRRGIGCTLVVLLVLLSCTAAHPTFSMSRRPSTARLFFENPAKIQVRQSHAARLTQDGRPDTTIDNHGGFSVASSVGVAVSATFTLAVIMSLSYSAYYRRASLKLQKQFLDRLGPLAPPQAQDQQAQVAPQVNAPERHRRPTRTAPNIYGLAVLMSSSAQLSPVVYSALQEEEPQPLIAPAEPKTKAPPVEPKSLGHHGDIMPLSRPFGQAAMDGQLLAVSRPPV